MIIISLHFLWPRIQGPWDSQCLPFHTTIRNQYPLKTYGNAFRRLYNTVHPFHAVLNKTSTTEHLNRSLNRILTITRTC